MKSKRKDTEANLNELIRLAHRLGANDAKAVSAQDISIDDNLENLCRDSKCEYYGLSVNCPPHVSGPRGFRELLKDYEKALVFKIDVPTKTLLSDNRLEVFKRLHEIAAGVERGAVEMGYVHSKAYAGGSCKPLFCPDHDECVVLAEGGRCRFPRIARPSMSGFGINVSKLMESAGWSMNRIVRETDPGEIEMGMLCGLILIG
jgi:predicted metal-binding protein